MAVYFFIIEFMLGCCVDEFDIVVDEYSVNVWFLWVNLDENVNE